MSIRFFVLRLRLFFVGVCLLLNFALAGAQVLDRIDVVPRENEADIVVRFAQKVLYQRHSPQNQGKLLRIFMRLVDSSLNEGDLMQQTLRSAKTDRLPGVSVLYPELVNGMLVTFPSETSYKVSAGSDGYSIIITVPLSPAQAPQAATRAPAEALSKEVVVAASPPVRVEATVSADARETGVAETTDSEARAKEYMVEARQALAAKDPATAINRLNRVLGLATNAQTESAQALIGEAREQNGEIAKAKAEYELYLKLFPKGADAVRVKERLSALPDTQTTARQRPLPKEAGPATWTMNGSVATYRYVGKSHIDSTQFDPAGLTTSTQKLSMLDQNSGITSVSFNARRRDAFTDTRFVFRNSDFHNYLSAGRDYNRTYSAYLDHNDRQLGYYVRAGRQNPYGAGVLERFDGIAGGYNLTPVWRLNAVYGEAVEFNVPYNKKFHGASIEAMPEVGRSGASLYYVEQTLDGFNNRRAIGSELRYFDGQLSLYGMLDYDTLYKSLNIGLVQGNYLDKWGNNYFFMYDRRRTPSYSLTNALGLPGFDSVKSMVDQFGLNGVRSMVKGNTAMADMFSAGVTHPLTERWQVGADYRMSKISGSNPVQLLSQLCPGYVPGDPLSIIGCTQNSQPITVYCSSIDIANGTCVTSTQSSGTTHAYTLQAIGSSLFVTNAVGVANYSYIEGPSYSGQSVGLSYVVPIGEAWRLDTVYNYYYQKDKQGTVLERDSPSLKLTYQWRNSLYLEGQVGWDHSRNSGELQSDRSRREYLYMGARWDFR